MIMKIRKGLRKMRIGFIRKIEWTIMFIEN